jgi:hypothetical protein
MLLKNSPAVMSSASETATCATTNAPRKRRRPAPEVDVIPSSLSDGSSSNRPRFAAFFVPGYLILHVIALVHARRTALESRAR